MKSRVINKKFRSELAEKSANLRLIKIIQSKKKKRKKKKQKPLLPKMNKINRASEAYGIPSAWTNTGIMEVP